MGTQRHVGVGYGIHITQETLETLPENVDLWDTVEDDFPLLDVSLCGNYWNTPEGMVVVIKSTFTELFDYTPTVLVANGATSVEGEGVEELTRFKQEFNLTGDLNWMVWSYEG